MILEESQIIARLRFIPDLKLLYVNNPKVACSTIKKALWIGAAPETFVEGMSPHNKVASPYLPSLEDLYVKRTQVVAATKFTVVRNPFARILSAYLDKVGRTDRDTNVFHPFARRFGISGEERLTFTQFLELIATEEPSYLDDHFAPQYVTTMYDFCPLDFIGRMEELEEVWAFLGKRQIAISEHRPHATNAAGLLATHYGPREIDIVTTYFDRDFELFGYSKDPGILAPVRPVTLPSVKPQVLTSLLGGYCDRNPGRRQRLLEGVARNVPDFNIDYSRAESRLVSLRELGDFSKAVTLKEITDWKLISIYSQEMLRRGMFNHAFSSVARLKQILYG